jgi:tetratricopeptide (TPR) repeat protein
MRSAWAALAAAALAAGGCRRHESKAANEGDVLRPKSTIVFRSADGRALTMEDLESATGPVNYEIFGDEDVPAEARSLHERGRKAGAAGDYKQAIALFTTASKLAPRWPYPIYDRAFTYLLMKDFDAARTDYLATVALAPRGYFTAITSADLLVREKKGELPVGTCLAYSVTEDVQDRGEKAKHLRALVARVPRLAPAWKDLAYLAGDNAERLALIKKGLAAQPDAETRGMLQINEALALDGKGEEHANAIRRLGELALDPQSTFGTAEMAKVSLALLAKHDR